MNTLENDLLEARAERDAAFNPDWSLLEAANKSLREHMAMVRAAQELEQQFRARVADALAELRDEVQVALTEELNAHVLRTKIIGKLDDTIAALLGDDTESCR